PCARGVSDRCFIAARMPCEITRELGGCRSTLANALTRPAWGALAVAARAQHLASKGVSVAARSSTARIVAARPWCIMEPLDTPDKDLPLRDDIRLLGRILGDTIRAQEGPPVFAIVEQI